MTKERFKAYLCRPYCMFYKEGKKEEMTCLAAQVVDSLVSSGQIDGAALKSVAKDSRSWAAHKEALLGCVCRYCAFRAEDCDFQSAAPSEDLEPCGGYIVLAYLKEQGMIDEQAMEAAR